MTKLFKTRITVEIEKKQTFKLKLYQFQTKANENFIIFS